ncbi:hypothetical protein SCUCBS95973_007428 [Sporothrix curviconia]|uniref:Uncharacterized protein n=1 Tax=Sporothrix curviconia TaxID=1260050 RepID=A0ABP0CD89_9PEZI
MLSVVEINNGQADQSHALPLAPATPQTTTVADGVVLVETPGHGRLRSFLGTWKKHSNIRLRLPFRKKTRTPVQGIFVGTVAEPGASVV